MAFIDNPTIATLGSAIGLGPLFDAATSGNTPSAPTASTPNVPGVRPFIAPGTQAPEATPYELAQNMGPPPMHGKSAPNIPVYKERPYLPHIIGNESKGGVKPGGLGNNPVAPGTMDPSTLQSPQVQALLGQYGIKAPTTPPDPNLFIRNPEAFQKHPLISGLLERGLEGLAYAHPGQNAFESLIGGVRGMQEAGAVRAAQANAQTMAPLQQAGTIQALMDNQQKALLEAQKAKEDSDYHQGLLAHYHASDMTKSERLAAIPPHYNPKTGQPSYYGEDENGKPTWTADPNWKEDPRTAVSRSIYDAYSRQLQKKYPSDDPKDPYKNVPPQELEDTFNKMTSHEEVANHASQLQTANIRANATTGAASIRANSSGDGQGNKISQRDRANLSQLNRDNAQHQKALQPVNGMVMGDDGRMMIADPANQDYVQHLATHKSAIARNNSQIQQILQGSGTPQQSGPPPVTPTANANPFRR